MVARRKHYALSSFRLSSPLYTDLVLSIAKSLRMATAE